ncbi:MAG: diguanylate cyclase [Vallitaleaceae bacterium]|nr:diguanylate cyclase [Vallitaleaceae bacterium]
MSLFELDDIKTMEIREEMMNCGSWEWRIEYGNQLKLSKRLKLLFGIDHEIDSDCLFPFEKIKKCIHQDDYEEAFEILSYHIEKKSTHFDILHRVISNKGDKRINHRFTFLYDEKNDLVAAVGVAIEASFDYSRDYTTRLNDEKFFRIFGDSPIGIALLRTDGSSFLCNDHFSASLIYKQHELSDLPIYTLIDEEDYHSFMQMYESLIEGRIPSFRSEYKIIKKNNERVWVDITMSAVRDLFGHIKYLVAMVQPCQRNVKSTPRMNLVSSIKEELESLSLKDPLSGLHNRQFALSRIKELILRFYEKNLSFSMLLIDIDRIKDINERYGHICGDKVIRDLSEIFRSLTRETDISARWGGEEFVLIFPEMEGDIAYSLAERLQNEIRNTILMWEGNEIQVTISVSVTTYSNDDTLKTFINKVDEILYTRKKGKSDFVQKV